jgi:anaerobic ribonucleoside-triphosphate reductase
MGVISPYNFYISTKKEVRTMKNYNEDTLYNHFGISGSVNHSIMVCDICGKEYTPTDMANYHICIHCVEEFDSNIY